MSHYSKSLTLTFKKAIFRTHLSYWPSAADPVWKWYFQRFGAKITQSRSSLLKRISPYSDRCHWWYKSFFHFGLSHSGRFVARNRTLLYILRFNGLFDKSLGSDFTYEANNSRIYLRLWRYRSSKAVYLCRLSNDWLQEWNKRYKYFHLKYFRIFFSNSTAASGQLFELSRINARWNHYASIF